MEIFDKNAIFTDVVSQTAIGKNAIMKQHEFAFNVVMENASIEMKNINSQTPDGKPQLVRHGAIQFAIIKEGKGNWKFKDVHNSDYALPYEKQERVLGYF